MRKYHILIVEDDTYGDISFEPLKVPAIYSLAKPGEVMYIGSFSKILGPGVRLGFFMATESIITRLMPWKMDGGTSMLSQLVAAEYFKDHLWDHIEEGRQAVKDKRNTLLDALEGEFGAVAGHAAGPSPTAACSCGSSCPKTSTARDCRSWPRRAASRTRPGRHSTR